MRDDFNNDEQSKEKKTFVLVHGAWQGPYAWIQVKELLEKAGFDVNVIQLPGHGSDNTDHKTLHMNSYINHVADVIKSTGKKVILVGHSMAGMIISGVAELVPASIEKLVYIAAYLPANGQSAYAISLLDKESLLGASLVVSDGESLFDVKRDDIINIFCQDGSAEIQKQILNNYKPEPAFPFSDPVTWTEKNFGSVAKYFVETLQDHGIGNVLQKQMIISGGVKRTYEVNSGHSPALSKPQEISEILTAIASF